MHRVRGSQLTPSQRHRLEATTPEPVLWSEWLTIFVLLGGSAAGVFWLGTQVFIWAISSPTARLVMQ